ncbi:MAG: 3-dehydroquinate synthase [Verrucomicrobiaceae bacterium TMED137]|nr:3-dehydroquinate synthase [Akkermansiaceae bacterium]MDB4686832.1 3-dehydroquinate synthase [Akkermansiaceae bacterium]OUV81219.1 MAG: 3-dehydroquinate synthase [Verrucomicrobiaceae bacterium TMED137]HAE18153.1 3-dehydroquinate synthase [Verrucomicrobiales bacterium]
MSGEDFNITVSFQHRVRFTRGAFAPGNRLMADLLETRGRSKVLVFVENGLRNFFPQLEGEIQDHFSEIGGLRLTGVEWLAGGEEAKRDDQVYQDAMAAIERHHIDRHSYVVVIGGGAFLDVIGFAASTGHRGVRLVRFPTTTLSQDDSGVGVKNGINAFGKKNFIGTFAVPYAVVNDFQFLHTQPELTRRAGLIEAVKVALVRDGEFFDWLEENVKGLLSLNEEILEEAVQRSAIHHARHISQGGDPFELGSSRPLDYGHWAAHKLEQLTDFELSHGEAVSVGVALDTLYAAKIGLLKTLDAERVLKLIEGLELPIWHEALELRDSKRRRRVFNGLEEFREHLGGELTVLLLKETGVGVDVHEIDEAIWESCAEELKIRAHSMV